MLSKSSAATVMLGIALPSILLGSALRSDTPRQDRDIMVIYVGAEDCAPCRLWQGGIGAKFRTSSEFRRLRYREIKSPKLYELLNDEVWPADLRVYRQRIDQTMAVPMWLVLLNGEVVAQGFGPSQWAETVMPTLSRLLN
jgi:hypothetical protein